MQGQLLVVNCFYFSLYFYYVGKFVRKSI